jgi:hypothetical protein
MPKRIGHSVRIGRIHPALKHGGYTALSVLPGESRAEFDKLHRNVTAEWSPSGATEEDIVSSIAHLLWRKQNLMTLHIAERARYRRDAIMRSADDLGFLQEAHDPLETDEEWQAAQDQIQEERQAAEEQVQKELGPILQLVEIEEAATFDGLEEELAIKERLDSLIAKCIKQLLQVKGVKSMWAGSFSVSPNLITGPSTTA